jgi:CheY-like chemotaxis protein
LVGAPVPQHPTAVLIVDDDKESAHSLARLLLKWGYGEVRSVYSAAAALESAVEFSPGIVLLDIDLPDMSGYRLAQLLRQHPHLQNIRLIALTDSGDHPGREHARASGFERYLVKPISAVALREVLAPATQ